MALTDLTAALLLPLPPWVGFWIFRRKGRVGLSYGYFLGGILAVLSLPWGRLTGTSFPAAQVGAALFGFTIFLQAQREGVQGVRRLVLGVGGATLFLLALLHRLDLPWQASVRFWLGALLEAGLWLLGADLAYRWSLGRHLAVRMPLVGAAALGIGALAQGLLPPEVPRWSWPAALLGGLLLGLVALQQLRWLRDQGAWVEGRGDGLRIAFSLLEQAKPEDPAGLAVGLESHQAAWLVDAEGRVLESNGALSREVGLPRHELRGYGMDALFQGGEQAVWAGLKSQLLQFGGGSVGATLVRSNGSFRPVTLQATSFDRGMALVWVADAVPGSLSLAQGTGSSAGDGSAGERLRFANALLALSAVRGQGHLDAASGSLLAEAEARLAATGHGAPPQAEAVPAEQALTRARDRLTALLPEGVRLVVQAPSALLSVPPVALDRLVSPLVLHALEVRPTPDLVLVLEASLLGGRTWGRLQVRAARGRLALPGILFGSAWLRQAAIDCGGWLALDRDETGGLHPRLYLPLAGGATRIEPTPLQGRTTWVVDSDPLAQMALRMVLAQAGAEVRTYPDLRAMLADSHASPAPDLLLLELDPKLERFQGALLGFQKVPVPTLLLGTGRPLPLDPAALGIQRLGFLEKPFTLPALLESALALLEPQGPEARLL